MQLVCLINMAQYNPAQTKIITAKSYYSPYLLLLSIKKYTHIIWKTGESISYRNMSTLDHLFLPINIKSQPLKYQPQTEHSFLSQSFLPKKSILPNSFSISTDAMDSLPELHTIMLPSLHWRRDGRFAMHMWGVAIKKVKSGISSRKVTIESAAGLM